MPPALMMALSALLFAVMGVCVKYAAPQYTPGELVFYRSVVGALLIGAIAHARGGSLRTRLPGMHLWRSVSGVSALALWFYALAKLPLATAMTLNYMSSVWMALFLLGGAVLFGAERVDSRLVAAVLAGFVGVALVLRPTVERDQLWHGLAGLTSGVLAAMAYLQVTALGRAGEPGYRVVFYFCLGGIALGAALALPSGFSAHTPRGAALLLAIGLLATVAQWLVTGAYARGHVLVNAALQYLGILFSFGFGVLLFDEALTAPAALGIALIVAAGIATTLLRARSEAAAHQPPEG